MSKLTSIEVRECRVPLPEQLDLGNLIIKDRDYTIVRVRDAVVHGGGQWIQDAIARLTHEGRVITVSGPESSPHGDGHFRVLCAHNPRIWKTSRHAGYDLVLAGHLHGCQLVACEYRDRLFPGALFYPYCFLSHQRGPTRLVVSRGVSDLGIVTTERNAGLENHPGRLPGADPFGDFVKSTGRAE